MRQAATYHSIQVLRAAAATLVVLFHAHEAFAEKLAAPFSAYESYLFEFGAVGVHIFFVISGFIMVVTSATPGRPYKASRFFTRRFLRIFPIYWVCALVYVAVHTAIGQPYDVPAGQFVRALLLFPEDSARLIGPAWTLSFEMYFYICFGLAMTLSLTRGLIVLVTVFVVAIGLGQVIHHDSLEINLVVNLLLLEFLAGAAIGWLAQAGWLPQRGGPALTALGAALFVAGIAYGFHRVPSVVSWGVPSAVLVFGIVTWETRSGASALVRQLGRLGDSSYVLYLIHVLTITLAATACQALGLAPAPALAAVIMAVIAIALAEAVHRGVELPLLSLLRQGGSRLFAPRGRQAPQPSE